MRGTYVIESEGRVLYVGQSEDVQERAKTHLRKINGGSQSNSKMYWVLQQLKKCGLNLKCWLLEETSKVQSLKGLEDKNIQQLKPVLNTLMPFGMTPYINKITTAKEALLMAEQNGRWNFTNLVLLWEIPGNTKYFNEEISQYPFFKTKVQEKTFCIYGIFIQEELIYLGSAQGEALQDIRRIEENGYKGTTNMIYLALKRNKNNYEVKVLWRGTEETEAIDKLNMLCNLLSPVYNKIRYQ